MLLFILGLLPELELKPTLYIVLVLYAVIFLYRVTTVLNPEQVWSTLFVLIYLGEMRRISSPIKFTGSSYFVVLCYDLLCTSQ